MFVGMIPNGLWTDLSAFVVHSFTSARPKQDERNKRMARLRSSKYNTGDGKSFEVGDYLWEQLTDSAAYAPRDGASGVVFDEKMFLIGGWNPNDKSNFPRTTSNDVWVSSEGVVWSQIKSNSYLDHSFDSKKDWEGRHSVGCLVFDNHIWIIGGDVNQGNHLGDIWKSNNGRDWDLVAEKDDLPWNPRALHLSFVFKDRMFVMGGQTLPQFVDDEHSVKTIYYNDVWSTTNGTDWIKHQSDLPVWAPRGGIGGNLVFRDRIWIVGGFTYDNDVNRRRVFSDIWSSADGNDWKKECYVADWAVADRGLMYHDLVVFDDKLWIVGGYKRNSGNTNQIWYSEDGVKWHPFELSPIAPSHSTTLFSYKDSLIIAAGNHMNREVWRLSRISKQNNSVA